MDALSSGIASLYFWCPACFYIDIRGIINLPFKLRGHKQSIAEVAVLAPREKLAPDKRNRLVPKCKQRLKT